MSARYYKCLIIKKIYKARKNLFLVSPVLDFAQIEIYNCNTEWEWPTKLDVLRSELSLQRPSYGMDLLLIYPSKQRNLVPKINQSTEIPCGLMKIFGLSQIYDLKRNRFVLI